MSFLARGLTNLIGIVAPVIHSFKVLKKPTKPKLIQCMHYWTIYGTFLIVDWFLSTFFITCFIPFYDFFTLTFTIFMAVPHIGFASALYTKFLAPFLRKYERRIDSVTGKCVDKIWETMPALAMTVPSVLASIVSAINTPALPANHFEIEETDESMNSHFGAPKSRVRRSQRVVLDQSFEIQEDSDENDGGDVFQPFPVREVKQEVIEDDEEEEILAPLPPRPVILAPMRTRRQLRARSVL